jgi:hypothetical protein
MCLPSHNLAFIPGLRPRERDNNVCGERFERSKHRSAELKFRTHNQSANILTALQAKRCAKSLFRLVAIWHVPTVSFMFPLAKKRNHCWKSWVIERGLTAGSVVLFWRPPIPKERFLPSTRDSPCRTLKESPGGRDPGWHTTVRGQG